MPITFGSASAPSQVTINLDALFATSLSNYRKTLEDNISTANAFLFKMMRGSAYTSVDGGTDLRVPLMYELGTFDWYDGYDTLNTDPMDGITQAVWEWRQASIPVSISRKEERQNAQNIIPLLKSKIMQAEMGIKEGWSKAFFRGNGAGSLETAAVSAFNGASGVDPIPLLVKKDPTTSTTIGNINQSTSTWWRNQSTSSAATTYDGLIKEFITMINNCAKGPGGPPDLIVLDQTTWELLMFALYVRYRKTEEAPTIEFPFTRIRWMGADIVWDEFVPDVQNGTLATTTKGTAYFLNTKFFSMKYDSQTNYISTPFMKPVNQDAKVSHILWMGATCVSNRRKHGVLYNIARTLT